MSGGFHRLIHVKAKPRPRTQSGVVNMEGLMPFETVVYLAFVLAALGVFAAALTYADWATRHANDHVRNVTQAKHGKPANPADTDAVRKAA